MPGRACRILSIAPYRVLPATTGGHWGIVSMHDALGKLCQDHVISTNDNGPESGYSFEMHRIFPPLARRYMPMYGLRAAAGIGLRYDATVIFCDHPYMAPLAIALSRKLKIPWVLRSHNIEAERFRHLRKSWWRIFHFYERYAMRAADGIFFITPEDCSAAIARYRLNPAKCHLAPYGTTLSGIPEGHDAAKHDLARSLSLNASLPWLYFLGVHSYAPNAEAVAHIIDQVHPRLKDAGLHYELIVGGKGLPVELQNAVSATAGGIRYLGFIEKLDPFLKACDIMLNPLTTGGGIKTKAVEALAYNKMVVSTANGAAGILPEVCGDNLLITPDSDWDAFSAAASVAMNRSPQIPAAFYQHYNWDSIARHVLSILTGLKRA